MAFVLPKWRAHRVHNWDELLVDRGNGEFDLDPVTAAVFNYMFLIGIPTLTSENAGDA